MDLERLKQLTELRHLAAIRRAEDWARRLPPAQQFERVRE
jgi:hypothetical protein